MLDDGTIILPIAGRSSRFPNMRPKWMLTAPHGPLMLELALRPVSDWRQRRVVIGALQEHLQDNDGEGIIHRALGPAPEIVSFEKVTRGPAETVAEIIRRAGVTGPILIKDCDSWFDPPAGVFGNVVCTADLRTAADVRNIPGKSFIQVNENGIITGIAEKVVCSNYISVGGYGFESAEIFLNAYDRVAREDVLGEPFVSHVILEAISMGHVFRSLPVEHYNDVGTKEAWQEFRDRATTYFVDLDGVVLRNAGAYNFPLWSEPDTPLSANVETLRTLADKGAQIVFITARPEQYRAKTEEALSRLGLKWHTIVFGLNHARRVLVNDFAGSNPYPSAVAVNIPRNEDDLLRWLGR